MTADLPADRVFLGPATASNADDRVVLEWAGKLIGRSNHLGIQLTRATFR